MQRGALRTVPLAAAALTLAMHLAGNPHYGFFRDELYFIICGMRPAWGYVDQPPIVPFLAAGSQLFGHSLFLLRAIPAIFAALSIYVTCLLAAELGGGIFAEIFAAVVAAFTPVLMSFGSKVTTDVVGLWLWPLAALFVLRIVKGADPRLWLAVGAIVGIAIESKYSMLFFIAAILVGLAAVPERRVFSSKWFAAGVLLATVIVLPNFLWQAQHGFPMWTLLHDAHEHKNVSLSPVQYLISQILIVHPLLAPVSIVGIAALFFWRPARFLGIAYVALIAAMIAFHGKHYYPGNVYPITIAAGAVVVERATASRRLLRPAAVAYVLAASVVLVPLLMPVLSEPAMAAYDRLPERFLSREVALAKAEHTQLGRLPPDWSDMHGWDHLAATVARVYYSLPPKRRRHAAILASNYGEAAAIDFFGKKYDLPPVLSANNQYWLWGTRGYSGNVVIDVHGECLHDAPVFRVRRVVTHFSNPWGRPFENGFPISLCEGITMPLADYWPKLRAYI